MSDNQMKVSHSNRTYEYVPPYRVIKAMGRNIALNYKPEVAGVWITLEPGVRVFRPNDFEGYEHITGLPLGPGEVYQVDL